MSYRSFVIIMSMLMAISPFAVDAYLPAMPSMATFFSVSTEQIATTISFYVLGSSIGMLIGGPLADRFGYKKTIIIGLMIFIAASLAITQAETLLEVQVARVIQSLGASFSAVCIPALVIERSTGNEAAKTFGIIGLIMIGAPAIAPSIGTLFITFFEWQSIFYFIVIYAVVVTILSAIAIPAYKRRQVKHLSTWRRYQEVLSVRPARRYAVVQAMIFSTMLVFLTNASVIFQDYYGVSEQTLSVLLALNIIVMAILNRVNSRLLNTYSAKILLNYGLLLQLASTIIAVILVALHAPMWAVATTIIFTAATCGGITPNVNAVYMSHFDKNVGSASAIAGSLQFLVAAASGSIAALLYNGTLWPIVLSMLTITIIGNLFATVKQESTPLPEQC